MRLAKHLAHAGIASRRASETLIAEGRVSVDGHVVRDPAREVGDENAIAFDGRMLSGPEAFVVYALNKPLGVLSTASDPYGRPTVVELVRESRRLYPVGRLDLDSEGLILLTNDGALAHALTHPRYEVRKTYMVQVGGGPVGQDALRRLRQGVRLEDGMTAPAEVERVGEGKAGGRIAGRRADDRRSRGGEAATHSGDGTRLLITIREGRNRQVRRMCEAVGHPVTSLRRVRFGSLELGRLAPGQHRRLTDAEVRALRHAAGGDGGEGEGAGAGR